MGGSSVWVVVRFVLVAGARGVTARRNVTDRSSDARRLGESVPRAMHAYQSLTDQELLGCEDPEAFGVFYDRHVATLLGYFARRTGDAEAAADLTAETFASAIVARRRFRASGPPAIAWLFG